MSGSDNRCWSAIPRNFGLRPFGISGSGLPAWFCFFLVICGSSASAREPGLRWDQRVNIGWQGVYFVGRWTPVTLDVEVIEVGDYQLHVTAPDPDGHRVTFTSRVVNLERGSQRLGGFFKVGERDPDGKASPQIEVRVNSVATGETELRWKSSGEGSSKLAAPLTLATRLIVTVGNPSGFDWTGDSTEGKSGSSNQTASATSRPGGKVPEFRTVHVSTDQLPLESLAYDGVSLFVLAGQTVGSTAQSAALRDWVAGGGRLVISTPANLDRAREMIQPLADWLPVTLAADPVTVREFGRLEHYAGRNVRIPFAGRMTIPGARIEQGEVLAGSRDEALLVRAPYVMGAVTVLALDLTQPPLSKWQELPALGRRLAEISPAGETVNARRTATAQLSSTGISDLATQLHASQDNFAAVTRASPWVVMGLLAVFLLLIGPIDYQIVHRVLKRPRATWVTFPLWVALAAVLASQLAAQWNGATPRVNQLNLVNLDVATGTCRQRMWTNIYSPETVRRTVRINSKLAPAANEDNNDSIHAGWSGIPETAFGGMLRPAGMFVGRTAYQQNANGVIDGLPLMQWSSKSLVTEIESHAESLVTSDLQSHGGRLSGTITQRFAGPIEDWFLVYGNRVYRQLKQRDDVHSLPLASGRLWRVEQPNVHQREVRAFLTGQVTVAIRKEGSTSQGVARQYTEYDPLSRDPAEIVRALTFHEETGGTKYSGLTNRLLEAEDLSHLLRLGRAILFGRLDSSLANIQIDGQTASPDREDTFVRIVLPVTKVGEDTRRELEKLEP